MRIIKKFEDRIFRYIMHSGNEKRKEKWLRKRIAYLGVNSRIYSDSFGSEPYLLSIGNNVIVASGVKFIEHDASYYNAYRYLNERACSNTEKMGAIILEDNCFIGADTILLGGTKVGKDSIVAAGSVVHGIVPAGVVWGGTPAKFIMTTKDYANKVKESAQQLPWANSREISNDELIAERKKYYFTLLERDN